MRRTGGAFVAILLIGLVNAFDVVMFQQAMLVLVFRPYPDDLPSHFAA